MVRVILLLSFFVPLWTAPAGWVRAATAKDCMTLERLIESPAPDERRWSLHGQVVGSALHRLISGDDFLSRVSEGGEALAGTDRRLRPCWDRQAHAITLDFDGGTVEAGSLGRLITTPNLLPEFAHAGLTIRDAVVDGTLEIAHATIGFPLRFEDVAFPNPQPDARARDEKSRVAIRIEDSEFEQTFELSRSTIRGLVFVGTSSFRDGLRITGSDLTYPPAGDTPTAGDATKTSPANAVPAPPHAAAAWNGASATNGSPSVHARMLDDAKTAAPTAPACAGLVDPDNPKYVAEQEALVAQQGATWISGDEGAPRSLQILYSDLKGLVQVQGNCFAGHVLVDHSGFKHVEFSRNLIAEGHLQITENEAFKLVSRDNRYGAVVDIANNRVASALDIIDDVIAPVRDTEPGNPPSYRLSVNTVGGSLWFGPAGITPAIPRLDLTYNDVVGPFEVCLPEAWPGAEGRRHGVDLAGTEVQSRLRLAARSDDGCSEEPRAAVPEATAPCHDRPEPASTVISLANASTGTLIWDLPGDCTYRWTGAGFEYGFIGPADWTPENRRAAEPAADAAKATPGIGVVAPAWAEGEPREDTPLVQPGADPERRAELFSHMVETKNPDALVRLAHYFRAQGMFDRSRTALLDAKEQNYKPRWPCSWSSASSYVNGNCLTGAALYGYLWLGGFGVEPERPFIILLAFWFLGWALYGAYHVGRSSNTSGTRAGTLRPRRRRSRVGPARTTGARMYGFLRYDTRRIPEDFSLSVFSLDAMLPVVDLHAYSAYFPENIFVRMFSYLQHVVGWLLITSLFTGLAAL